MYITTRLIIVKHTYPTKFDLGNFNIYLDQLSLKDITNILQIEEKEKVWGTVLFLDVVEDGKEKKFQFSIVQDWVKYPLSAPTKFLKVDWSRFVKYIKDKQIITN